MIGTVYAQSIASTHQPCNPNACHPQKYNLLLHQSYTASSNTPPPPLLISLTFSPNPTFPPLRRYLLSGLTRGPSSGLCPCLSFDTFRPSNLANFTPPLSRCLLFGPTPGPSPDLSLCLNLGAFRPSNLANLTLPPSSNTARSLGFSFAFTFAWGYPKD